MSALVSQGPWWRRGAAYDVVLDAVDVGVDLGARLVGEVVSDGDRLDNSNLFKRPLSDLLRKRLVGSLGLLSAQRLHLQPKELIREQIRRARDRNARIVERLQRRDIMHLRPRRPGLLSVRKVLFGVVRVCGP